MLLFLIQGFVLFFGGGFTAIFTDDFIIRSITIVVTWLTYSVLNGLRDGIVEREAKHPQPKS